MSPPLSKFFSVYFPTLLTISFFSSTSSIDLKKKVRKPSFHLTLPKSAINFLLNILKREINFNASSARRKISGKSERVLKKNFFFSIQERTFFFSVASFRACSHLSESVFLMILQFLRFPHVLGVEYDLSSKLTEEMTLFSL